MASIKDLVYTLFEKCGAVVARKFLRYWVDGKVAMHSAHGFTLSRGVVLAWVRDAEDLPNALRCAIPFSKTTEGADFWESQAKKLGEE